jgi:hypothetical protein
MLATNLLQIFRSEALSFSGIGFLYVPSRRIYRNILGLRPK